MPPVLFVYRLFSLYRLFTKKKGLNSAQFTRNIHDAVSEMRRCFKLSSVRQCVYDSALNKRIRDNLKVCYIIRDLLIDWSIDWIQFWNTNLFLKPTQGSHASWKSRKITNSFSRSRRKCPWIWLNQEMSRKKYCQWKSPFRTKIMPVEENFYYRRKRVPVNSLLISHVS